MRFRALRRKRVWIPALVLACLEVGGWAWADRTPGYADPAKIPFTTVRPSPGSLHSAPFYGTRVRFEDTAAAFARAGREDKLVLLLHLSGKFGSSETT